MNKDTEAKLSLQHWSGILRVRGSALDLDYIERWVTEMELVEQWRRARVQGVARWRPGFEGSLP